MSEIMREALELAAVGVTVVFVALIVTGIVASLVGHLFKEKPPVPAAAVSLPEEKFGAIDKHVLVLLAAAATVAVKRPIRIQRVRFVSHKHIPASWAAAGRTDHVQEQLH